MSRRASTAPERRGEQGRIDSATVLGWGIDADPRNDPTYPMRDRGAERKSGLDWPRPPLQRESVEILRSTEHDRRTAVFGTSVPPRGLSGALRRQAFHSSEGKWSHWLLLLAADRINMVEGLLDDLRRGRVPNVLGEMGLRSELKHNRQGFLRKVVFAGVALTVAYSLLSAGRDRR